MVIQHQRGRAFQPKIKRQRQPDRAATNNDDRVSDGCGILRGYAYVGVELKGGFIACCDHFIFPC